MNYSEQLIKAFPLVIVSFAIAFFTSNLIWLIVPIIVALSISIRFMQSTDTLPQLHVERYIKEKRYKENDIVKIVLTIENTSEIDIRGELFDVLPSNCFLMEGSNIVLLYIEPGEKVQISYSIRFPVRGQQLIGPTMVRFHTEGELLHITTKYEILSEILIIPVPERITKYNIPPSFLTQIGGSFRSKIVGEGMDFTGIREYQTGDNLRRINWKQTAKYQTLYSNEYEINRAGDFFIVLDLTEEDNLIADSEVRVVLGLATYLMNNRCRIGLVTIAEYVHIIPIKAGKRQLIEMTEHLTRLKSIPFSQNPELAKLRIRDGIKKIQGMKNEFLLFSSLNDLEKTIDIANNLSKKGNITIISPTFISKTDATNKKYNISLELINIRNKVISNYLKINNINIYTYVPELPFNLSAKLWRERYGN